MPTVYGLCNNNCRYPVYTQEQVLSILQQAIDAGNLQGINPDDSPVVALIRETNKNVNVSLWVGTESEYNTIAPGAGLVMGRIGADGKLYFCTNDTTLQDWYEKTVADAETAATNALTAKQDKAAQQTATLTVAGWSNGAQTVTVSGVTASNVVIVAPAPDSQDNYTAAGIKCTAQSQNALTFVCTETPAAAVIVNVVILK